MPKGSETGDAGCRRAHGRARRPGRGLPGDDARHRPQDRPVDDAGRPLLLRQGGTCRRVGPDEPSPAARRHRQGAFVRVLVDGHPPAHHRRRCAGSGLSATGDLRPRLPPRCARLVRRRLRSYRGPWRRRRPAVERAGHDHRGHRGAARGGRGPRLRGRVDGDHRRLRCPRETRVRSEHGLDLPPSAADPVPRRPARRPPTTDRSPPGVGHRLDCGGPRLRRERPPLPRPGRAEPTARHHQAHRVRPARVRHLARRQPPGGGQLRRPRASPHRGLQVLGVDQARPLHRPTVKPRQHQEPADQPALLLRPDHRVGIPQPATTAADLRRRPPHRRQAPAAVPRRRRRRQTDAGLAS